MCLRVIIILWFLSADCIVQETKDEFKKKRFWKKKQKSSFVVFILIIIFYILYNKTIMCIVRAVQNTEHYTKYKIYKRNLQYLQLPPEGWNAELQNIFLPIKKNENVSFTKKRLQAKYLNIPRINLCTRLIRKIKIHLSFIITGCQASLFLTTLSLFPCCLT